MIKASNVYKPGEFAKMIGVSLDTLRRWDKSGKLKAARHPSNIRYYTHEQYLWCKHSTELSVDLQNSKVPCVYKVTDSEVTKVFGVLKVVGVAAEFKYEDAESFEALDSWAKDRFTLYFADELDKLGVISWLLHADDVLKPFSVETKAGLLLFAFDDENLRKEKMPKAYEPTEGTRVMWAVNCVQYLSELTTGVFLDTLYLLEKYGLFREILDRYDDIIHEVVKGLRRQLRELLDENTSNSKGERI